MTRILVIDDSKSVHAFLRDCFSGKQVEMVSASNGEEGVGKFGGSGPFELIFLDWEMPVMDGPKTFQELKSKGNSTPVIMMTSRNQVSDITEMLGAGVSEYLMKPFTKDILFEKLSFVLGAEIK